MATNPKITPSRQRTLDGNTKHTIQRPTVTPVVSLNGCRLTNNPKPTSPQQPRMPQTRLTSAHNVLGFASSIRVHFPLRPSMPLNHTIDGAPHAGRLVRLQAVYPSPGEGLACVSEKALTPALGHPVLVS